MANYYLTIGYPLMVAASSVVDGYSIEVGSTEEQTLPNDIALVWANLLSCDHSDDKASIEQLAGHGVLYAGQSKSEILTQCNNFHPYRQGIGSTFKEEKDNESDVLYFSVMLGKENFTLSEFQRQFWERSNGTNTISNILDSINKEIHSLNNEEIANQVFALIKFGLLFIKK